MTYDYANYCYRNEKKNLETTKAIKCSLNNYKFSLEVFPRPDLVLLLAYLK